MSAVITESTPALPEQGDSRSDTVQRQAFYLRSQGQPLFAWLHAREHGPNVDHGVVICPPIGHEQLHSHRSLRHLADALAGQGIPTLRFDWHGTGDSAGLDEDGARGVTWQANIRDALDWMRQELGCRQVSVIGLRLGATLAALASEDHEVANLVLWAPVTNGRAYVREMMAIDLTSEFQPTSKPGEPGDIEAAGFVLSKLAAAELSLVNLLKSHPHCRHGLIVARDDVPADYRLLDRCSDLGFPVEQISVPGFTEMLAEPHRGQVPARAIHEISTWLRQQIYSEAVRELPPHPQPLTPAYVGEGSQIFHNAPAESRASFDCLNANTAVMKHRPELSAPNHGGPSIRSRTLTISSDPDLFGIISEPVAPIEAGLPTIILLNSGSTHRIGPGRLHVHIARQLAANGFRCVRVDINGLGDSVASDATHENATYPSTVFRDVELTLKKLSAEFGTQKHVLMGLCSGAYGAFQSAVCVPDPTIVESILINPLTFFWKDGMSLETAPVKQLVAQHHYLGSALQPKKWLKLLSGKSKIGLLGALRMVAQRLNLSGRTGRTSRTITSEPTARGLGHPLEDDLPADLRSIQAAGRTLTMIFAASDPGHSILLHKAKRQAEQMRKAGRLKVAFIKDADHTFSRRGARRVLIEMLVQHLCRHAEIESRS